MIWGHKNASEIEGNEVQIYPQPSGYFGHPVTLSEVVKDIQEVLALAFPGFRGKQI